MSDPRNRRTVFLALGLALISVVLALLISGFLPESNLGSQPEETVSFDEEISTVRIDLDNAYVEFFTGGSNVVVERSTAVGEAKETVSGDTLVVEFDCPFLGLGCKGSYRINVPPGTRLEGSTDNGAILLVDVDGPVDLSTSNGRIEMQRVTADTVVLHTSNGAITGWGVTSPSVDLRTSNGRIEVSFAEAPDSVRARTSNGRIEILVPSGSGPYRVDASASNGRTQIDVDTSRSAELEMDLSTSNGNIFVRYAD